MDYKKILEGVVDIINTTEKSDIGFANICTYIGEKCPELKESEDERIRKGIIALIEFGLDDKSAIAPGYNITKEEAIAWLEKQGEQKQTWEPSAAQLIVIEDLIEDENTSKVNKVILRGMYEQLLVESFIAHAKAGCVAADKVIGKFFGL